MNKAVLCGLAAGLLLLATADDAVAQETRSYSDAEVQLAEEGGGGGGFFDWIHKLSGPRFVGPRVSAFYEFGGEFRGEPGLRLRLDLATRWAVDREGTVAPATASIMMHTAQLGLELPVLRFPFYVAPAFALHRFTGDAFTAVNTWSVPFTIGFRPRSGRRLAGLLVVPVVNASIHYFPAFDASDFLPLQVTVSRDNSEAVLQFAVGFDIRR